MHMSEIKENEIIDFIPTFQKQIYCQTLILVMFHSLSQQFSHQLCQVCLHVLFLISKMKFAAIDRLLKLT